MSRNRYLPLLMLLLLVFLVGSSLAQSRSVLFKAMQDELDRSVADLVMEDLERPYFLSYTVDDVQQLDIKASLGALLHSQLNRSRYLTVDLRVGNHAMDNSNFVDGWSGTMPQYRGIPVDDNYDAVRNQIYLATDRAYKEELKALSKKRAYLQSRVMKQRPDDLLQLPKNDYTDKTKPFDLDRPAIEKLIRTASEVLKDYPMVVSSELKAEAGVINQYYLASNGSRTLRADRVYVLALSLAAKNDEGEDVSLADRLVTRSPKRLPSPKELTAWTRDNAEKIQALVSADTLEEYIGPVILTRAAAGEFLRQLFAANITGLPSPIYSDERFGSMFPAPEFANKVNRRVLPAFFDVYDDPTIKEYQGRELIGHYAVDDAGGLPQRVQLVEKGKLKSLPIGIAPTKKVAEPNGHARGAVSKKVGAKPANLIFESADQVSLEQLKATMIELCQDVDMEYGLVIASIKDVNAPSTRGFSFFRMPGGSESKLTEPLEVYKVYADGREVPVRGLEFANVTVRILRDILQTDDESYVYNYLIADDYEMPASIVCPSILIEEMELKRSEGKTQKPPVLTSPLADR